MRQRTGFVSNSSTTSFIILGVRLGPNAAEEAFFDSVDEPCKCRPPAPRGAKYCPKCGLQMGRKGKKPKAFLKLIKPFLHEWSSDYEFSGVKLISLGFSAGFLVACHEAHQMDDLAFTPVLSEKEITKRKETLKRALEPLGLWDEKKFGFYGGEMG